MSKELIESLKTQSPALNKIVKLYLIDAATLRSVVIGHISFKDIYHDFLNSLREYSINDSCAIDESEFPSCKELLKLNKIHTTDLRELVQKINQHLISQTDTYLSQSKKRTLLHKQLDTFMGAQRSSSDPRVANIIDKLSKDIETKQRYFDSIISAMSAAELHQIDDSKYLVVDKLLVLYTSALDHNIDYTFKSKRKYLHKLKYKENKYPVPVLVKYIRKMLNNAQDGIETVQWFLFYLLYGGHKWDIYAIHSILGYKYDGAVKVYQKLFLKDHTTGKSNDFLLDFNIFALTEKHLVHEPIIMFTLPNTKDNLAYVKCEITKDKDLSLTIEGDKLIIISSRDCYNTPIYQQIINSL